MAHGDRSYGGDASRPRSRTGIGGEGGAEPRRRRRRPMLRTVARSAAEALDRPAHADRRDDVAGRGRCTAALTDATPGLALLDALHPPGRRPPRHSDAPRRADVQRQHGALRHDPAQTVRRLQRHDAPPSVTLADEQLHALAGLVAQRRQHSAGPGRPAGSRRRRPDPAARGRARARSARRRRGAPGRGARGPIASRWAVARGRPVAACSSARPSGPPACRAPSTAATLSTTPTFDTLSTDQELYPRM